jgi:hypothetical protein
MTYRQTVKWGQQPPLKYVSMAEGRQDVVVDYSTIPPDGGGRRIVSKGALLCRITAGGRFGPYDPDAGDGRETVSPYVDQELQCGVSASYQIILTRRHPELKVYYHNCVFDLSQIRSESEHGDEIGLDDLTAAFPTCTFDD